jgi:hypothetical protein
MDGVLTALSLICACGRAACSAVLNPVLECSGSIALGVVRCRRIGQSLVSAQACVIPDSSFCSIRQAQMPGSCLSSAMNTEASLGTLTAAATQLSPQYHKLCSLVPCIFWEGLQQPLHYCRCCARPGHTVMHRHCIAQDNLPASRQNHADYKPRLVRTAATAAGAVLGN